MSEYIPVLIMILLAAATSVGILVATTLIGPKKRFAERWSPSNAVKVRLYRQNFGFR